MRLPNVRRAVLGAGAALLLSLAGWELARGTEPALGRVGWLRDADATRAAARASGKPVMTLLVPAAGGPDAEGFGRGALSHPIVVDAAGEFVALVVAGGAATPTVRFTGGDGQALAGDLAGEASPAATAALLARMQAALRAAGRPVPRYLALVAGEYNPARKQTAGFAVGCYWKGENELGRLDGILATRTGTAGGEEVVEVDFDPGVLDYRTLSRHASAMACFRAAYPPGGRVDYAAGGPAEPRQTPAGHGSRDGSPAGGPSSPDTSSLDTSGADQQHHLSLHPAYHFLPLTGLQATKVNAALSHREPADDFLSPGQVRLKDRMKKLFDADRHALHRIEQSLKPDRSPRGLPAYAREIERRVRALE